MPQPPLPIELVALILKPFHDLEDDGERRELGKRIGLVCRTWLPLGRGIVWSRVSIQVVADQRLAGGLVAHPAAAAAVRHLVVEPDEFELVTEIGSGAEGGRPSALGDDDMCEAALIKSVEVVEACARLDSLAFDLIHPSNLFDRISRARMAATLTRLRLSVTLRHDFGGADLFQALGRFASLKDVQLVVCDTQDVVSDLNDVVATCELPAVTLELDILVNDPVKARILGGAIHGLFDPTKMQDLVVSGFGAASPSFQWLSRYEYLDTVCLAALNGDDFDSAFTNVVAALSAHPRVRHVLFVCEPAVWLSDDLPPPAPLHLHELLKALPPFVRRYVVKGLTFEDTLGLLDSPRVDKPVDDVRVELLLRLPEDDEGRVRRETAVHRERTGDGVSWGLLQTDESHA
ncbi:hypothetical protein JCM8208_006204 [Rhodotorula glutinis]